MKTLSTVFQYTQESKKFYAYESPITTDIGFKIYLSKSAVGPDAPKAVIVEVREVIV